MRISTSPNRQSTKCNTASELVIVLAVGPMVLYGAYRVAERYAYTVICAHSSSDMRLVAEQIEAEGYVPKGKPFTPSHTVVPKPSFSGQP